MTSSRSRIRSVRHLAYHDALTGLPNRMFFRERLDAAIAHSRRSGEPVAVFFLDIDGFKRVNDRLGHDAGDRLLVETGARLRSLVRSADTVARIGGDEFVILLPGVPEEDSARFLARKILAGLRTPFALDGGEVFMTASLGLALASGVLADGEVLVRNADAAMYRAKEMGRDREELFTDDLHVRDARRMALESEMRRLVEGGFDVTFRPIVEIATGRRVAIDAVASGSAGEPIDPPEEIAARCANPAVAASFGRRLLGKAVSGAAAARAGDPDLVLSVAVASSHLRDPGSAAEIATILSEMGHPPEKLLLQIEEPPDGRRLEGCLEAIHELRRLGIRLCLDRFGGSRSSLDSLRQFAFDAVRLDAALIRRLPAEPRDAAIAKSILRLGHQLDFLTIADGVEREEQMEFLKYHRCGWGETDRRPLARKEMNAPVGNPS